MLHMATVGDNKKAPNVKRRQNEAGICLIVKDFEKQRHMCESVVTSCEGVVVLVVVVRMGWR